MAANRKKKAKICFIRSLVSIMIILISCKNFINVSAATSKVINLEGNGTCESPYQIRDVEDFCYFRDLVNTGEDFTGNYFIQLNNIDLVEIDNWEPIGIYDSGNYFYGNYNGNGHNISNLTINRPEDNAGLFGQLGGTVYNLGIESGSINSNCSGSIASHSVASNALIINCYNKASVTGLRAGGIVDNFVGGTIINCWNVGEVVGDRVAGIVSYDASAVINCAVSQDSAVNQESFNGDEVGSSTITNDMLLNLRKHFDEQIENGVAPLEQAEHSLFVGEGTEKKPYLIKNVDDLRIFRDMVNAGGNFNNKWISQNVNINLAEIDNWKPIGIFGTGKCFFGVYDGSGHTISNLMIDEEGGNVGLFGQLGGIVLNLGIESGTIRGDCVGAITSHSSGNPMIINCYNKATLVGKVRAGGIADNFAHGIIANSYNLGSVEAPISANIVSYDAMRVMECHSLNGNIVSDEFQGVSEKSNTKLETISEISHALNSSLYRICTKTNYQHNNLFQFDEDGFFSNRYNYQLRYLLSAVITGIIILIICVGGHIIYTASVRKIGFGATVQYLLKDNLLSCFNSYKRFFLIAFMCCMLFMLVGYICGDHTITRTFIWSEGEDAFMDFFNPLRVLLNNNYASEGFYTEQGGAYPPVARAIIWLLGQTLSYKYTIGDAFSIRSNSEGLLLWTIFYIFVSIIIYCCYKKILAKGSEIIAFALLFTYPMLNIFERGNIIIISYSLVLGFLLLYNNDRASLRLLSYIFLGFAAAIKIYPAVFGLAVVATKKKKEIFICLLCGIVIFLLSFAFVGGIPAFIQYIRNVTESSVGNSFMAVPYYLNFSNVIGGLLETFGCDINGQQQVMKYSLYIMIFLLAICACCFKEKYKSWLSMVLIMILLPGFSCTYMTIFYILPLLIIFEKQEKCLIDYAYLIILFIMIIPLNFLTGVIGISREQIWMLMGVCGILLAIILIGDKAYHILKSLRNVKS